ncbi:MAG: UDP-N-acetylglucosamine 2-epimerase, partial [Gaiella sp.]|uniref:UDP-N-acetylglucosamine 2-epimerase n=1 Tax=Gaiella sp. TaxID=2663207 RepID=UPI003C7920DD
MRVLTVVGNRPQFVKSAPLSVALREAEIEEIVVHTGQHWDPELSQVFFEELGLPEPAQRLDLRTAEIEALTPAVRAVVDAERPDAVLVLGDTNSTLAGARAAAAAGLPLAHVEAGLRSGDLSMPEERARIEVDGLAVLLLCPDERSVATLAAEGVAGKSLVVGDVMADATLRFAPIARERVPPPHDPGTYVVATVHREANVRPERLRRIVGGLARV